MRTRYSCRQRNSSSTVLASNPKQEEDMPILRDEIEKAIKQLKDRKAAGVDNIPGELLKHGGESHRCNH